MLKSYIYNSLYFKQMNQNQIDELLNQSSSQQEQHLKQKKDKTKKQQVEDYQDQDFQQQIPDGDNQVKLSKNNMEAQQQYQFEEKQQIDDENQMKKGKQVPQNQLEEVSQIQSEYASQAHDQVVDQLQPQEQSDSFKKDDDLSIAQSEFIESSNLNKSKQVNQNNNAKLKTSTFILDKNKQNKNVKTNANNKLTTNKDTTQRQKKPSQKVSKLSAEQIQQKMKQIKQEKNKMQKIKKQKAGKQDQKKKDQYQQALKKQNQRKQKNKKILEEQKNNKKNKSSINEKKIQSGKNIQLEAQNQISQKKTKTNAVTQQLKNQKKMQEKEIQKTLIQRNKQKLKQLQPEKVVNKVIGEKKKQQFWSEANDLKKAKMKEKNKQQNQVDTVIVKKLKTEIKDQQKENKIKRSKIFEFEKQIQTLKSKLKSKEKTLFKQPHQLVDKKQKNLVQNVNFSELSPIQKFVSYFPQAHGPQQIFNIIDENHDGMLTLAEIETKISQMGVNMNIISEVHLVLDKNSDGNITLQEFSFIIEQQIKRQKDYREIMQEIQIIDPIDIQASILDMRAKVSYMDKHNEREENSNANRYEQKYKLYLQKLKKMEDRIKVQKKFKSQQRNTELTGNSAFLLAQQAEKLAGERVMLETIINSIQKNINTNLQLKNNSLLGKVQENMRLKQKIYRFKNQIQQLQLRYISMKKIKQNKKGYLERQTENRNEMEDVYRKAKEYQLKIADPTKQVKNRTYINDIKFLAAVVMIQRNYRKKKAQRETDSLKGK